MTKLFKEVDNYVEYVKTYTIHYLNNKMEGKMFINMSNHPMEKWSEKQLTAAKKLGDKQWELPFPMVDPTYDKEDLINMAYDYIYQILENFSGEKSFKIHIMGEMGFVYNFIRLALDIPNYNFEFFHSTTRRIVEEKNGNKVSTFEFVKFREY